MMDPWSVYYICLISSLHCLIVTWLAVAIETPTTEQYEHSSDLNNSSVSGTTGHTQLTTTERLLLQTTQVDQLTTVPLPAETTESSQTTSVQSFISGTTATNKGTTIKSPLDFMPACPPPNNLHLICDHSLGEVSCSERATVLQSCYNRFSSSYMNSSWEECISFDNYCGDIVGFLARKKLLTYDALYNKKKSKSSNDKSKFPEVTSQSVSSTKVVTKVVRNLSTSEAQITSGFINSEPHSSGDGSATSRTVVTMSLSTGSTNISTQAIISTPLVPVLDESNSMDTIPPASWVYPLFGCLAILVEIFILWYFFWYKRKAFDSPASRYRRASTGSMVLQEELIEPESTSPTKALYVNSEFNPDEASKEDEKIFNSYLNLRFIDDSSVEGTPERIIIK